MILFNKHIVSCFFVCFSDEYSILWEALLWNYLLWNASSFLFSKLKTNTNFTLFTWSEKVRNIYHWPLQDNVVNVKLKYLSGWIGQDKSMSNNGQDFLPIRSMEASQWPSEAGKFIIEKTEVPRSNIIQLIRGEPRTWKIVVVVVDFFPSRAYTLRLLWNLETEI